ncbi:hypothetical protein JHD48_04590 [Sulfurimonas sp. SAG-AH-194-I05]|nr:hypothetical protein [Sulfurimonas sp. SAG-AH-194-I05]MDF1875008.1 hypothetical protein [Sulfurimonas sp. SAG-AH-194-I05]
MFVSSYNTYIQTKSNEKTNEKQRKIENESFSSKIAKSLTSPTQKKLSTALQSEILNTSNTYNKVSIQNQKKSAGAQTEKSLNKFTASNTVLNAKNAYEENAQIRLNFRMPHAPLNQTPSLEKSLPQEPKEIIERNMRYKMVNTYISNDNYFKVTA